MPECEVCNCDACGRIVDRATVSDLRSRYGRSRNHDLLSGPNNPRLIRVCPRCVRDGSRACNRCQAQLQNVGQMRAGGQDLCWECFNETHECCANCNREYLRADNALDEEDGYCVRCGNAPWGAEFVSDGRFDVTHSTRRFGVELETAFVPSDYKKHIPGLPFRTVHDGSITGKEFISRPLSGDLGLEQIAEFCRRMAGCKVDRACGFHLHIDARDLTRLQAWNVVMGYRCTQKTWFSLVPACRADNSHCRRMGLGPRIINRALANGRRVVDYVYGRNREYRYKWFNVMSMTKHGTMEVRLHSGTMNAEKINNWVLAHLKFWNWLIVQPEPKAVYDHLYRKGTFKKLCAIWESDRLTRYYTARREQFASSPELVEV